LLYSILGLLGTITLVIMVAGVIACSLKKRASGRRFHSRRYRKHFYIRPPKFFKTRKEFLDEKEIASLGRRTQNRRKTTNIKMPLVQVKQPLICSLFGLDILFYIHKLQFVLLFFAGLVQ